MEKQEVQARVKKVVSRVLKMDETEITDNANFIFDLGADSMQSLELVAGFEEEFDIEMDQDRALEIQTIDGAVLFIQQCLN
ncbi:MAG: acyl carrier protein [Cyclobacteriaceae bacterium]|jgi:acyl carrier protein|nr:acyl carrier protein [Cyclobacteriaceae bacterium]